MTSAFHVYFGPEGLATRPEVRKIGARDCFAALAEGVDDFRAMPSHLAFLGAFYVFGGMVLTYLGSLENLLQLVFPVAAGFAIVGPFLAIGLYEMSRRREAGVSADWRDAFAVLRSPALPAIGVLGLMLAAIFAAWIAAAEGLYVWLYGPEPPTSAVGFITDVFTTSNGWALILVGGFVGFCFAALALCVSVVSFPLLLDRDVGVVPAVGASLRMAWENPGPVALWGLIVAAGLVLGSLPLFIGLAIVMPVLGHATWRLYRRAIVRDPAHERPVQLPVGMGKPPRYHTSAHSFLFPWPESETEDKGGG
ncbi:MAG: DUF2189 domain-containing protein [Hyphomicrobiales bacterium]|nr:DUF2189 domain-containing protein [Hyphomicrobiales bacterium]